MQRRAFIFASIVAAAVTLVGTPISLYSPAPPVWQFIAANKFSWQPVVLFNTFNGKFEQIFINQFKVAILSRGGNFTDHIWVKRGRMTQQIDAEDMLQKPGSR